MKILVATHGTLARGFESASRVIVGQCDQLYTYCGYIDSEQNVSVELHTLINRLAQDDQLLILTDILGGSVNTLAMSELNNENIYIISGLNLGLLLQLLMFPNKTITKHELMNIIEEAKSGVLLINSEVLEDEEF